MDKKTDQVCVRLLLQLHKNDYLVVLCMIEGGLDILDTI